jgi:predicted MFS family arabinose efflux permease
MQRSLYILSLGMFALGLDAYVVAGLLPGIADSFGISISSAGMTVAVFTVFYALSAPVFATMLAGKPAKSILSIALIVFTVANAGTALAPSFEWLLAMRALAGAGAGLYSPLAAASAASLVGEEQRGTVLGFILGGMSLGTVIGVPIGLIIAQHIGWHGVLWIVAALGAVAFIGLQTFFPQITPATPPSLQERLSMLQDRHVFKTVSITFLVAVASLGLYTYVTPMLADATISKSLTLFLAAWGLGGIIGSFSIGRIIDWATNKERIIAFIIIALIVVFAFLPASLHFGALALIPFFLWGLLGWATQAPQQHSLLAAHPHHGSAAVALNSSANYLGSAGGAFVGGAILQAGFAPHDLPFAAAATAGLALAIYSLLPSYAGGTRHAEEGARP